jgi:hypothetical protein
VGRSENEYVLVHVAFGLVLWESVFGLLLTLSLPYTIPLIIVAAIFFYRLRKAYSPISRVGGVPAPTGAPLP